VTIEQDCKRIDVDSAIRFHLNGLENNTPQIRKISIESLTKISSESPIFFLDFIEYWKGNLDIRVKDLTRIARSKVRHVPIRILG